MKWMFLVQFLSIRKHLEQQINGDIYFQTETELFRIALNKERRQSD